MEKLIIEIGFNKIEIIEYQQNIIYILTKKKLDNRTEPIKLEGL